MEHMDETREAGQIRKRIEKIVESLEPSRTDHENSVDDHVNGTMDDYKANTFDFSGFSRMILSQEGKPRIVRSYDEMTTEEILSIYLKQVLDQYTFVTYPNRNTYIRSLFNIIYAVKDMGDYTIFKFDFADFYNSVSAVYVYEKYLRGLGLERYQDKLLRRYVDETVYAYAGLSPSNIICEVAAKEFDDLINQSAIGKGLIYYRRYVDDGIMIFNRYVSKAECGQLVDAALQAAFYDKSVQERAGRTIPPCKTQLNAGKTKYIARRDMNPKSPPAEFDFLGYLFELKIKRDRTEIKYGITEKKIAKYSKRLKRIVRWYASSAEKKPEQLKHRIRAFTHRSVYRVKRGKELIWKNKGFVANYGELRYHMGELTDKTREFLQNGIRNAFDEQGVSVPYYLSPKDQNTSFSLYNNLAKNRTLIFVQMIGIDQDTLKKMCMQVDIDTRKLDSYDKMVCAYLNEVGVGY